MSDLENQEKAPVVGDQGEVKEENVEPVLEEVPETVEPSKESEQENEKVEEVEEVEEQVQEETTDNHQHLVELAKELGVEDAESGPLESLPEEVLAALVGCVYDGQTGSVREHSVPVTEIKEPEFQEVGKGGKVVRASKSDKSAKKKRSKTWEEVKTPLDRGVCRFFHHPKGCRNGDSCQFSHTDNLCQNCDRVTTYRLCSNCYRKHRSKQKKQWEARQEQRTAMMKERKEQRAKKQEEFEKRLKKDGKPCAWCKKPTLREYCRDCWREQQSYTAQRCAGCNVTVRGGGRFCLNCQEE